MFYTQEITYKQLDNTHTQYFCGYSQYWNLIARMEKMRKDNVSVEQLNLSKVNKIYIFMKLMCSYFFSATIKPLKQFYSYQIKITGSCEFDNQRKKLLKNNLKKRQTWKLFGVPFFTCNRKITPSEWEKIMC